MKIAIFGGDKRMLFAARSFADKGYEVYVAGFDRLISLCDIHICGYEEAAQSCDIAVLPVKPFSGEIFNTPFSKQKISTKTLFDHIGEKPVFTGSSEMVLPYAHGVVFDYSAEELFTLKNAELTAEGAIGIIVRDYEGSVCGTEILVTGYGRIGKCLSAYLTAMGAYVTVAARKQSDRDLVLNTGMNALDYPDIDYSNYKIIINTVPALVMSESAVDRMRDDVYLIDLASVPGGIDFDRVKERDLSCIHALSLPGKTAPLTAGTIITDTVLDIMSRDDPRITNSIDRTVI